MGTSLKMAVWAALALALILLPAQDGAAQTNNAVQQQSLGASSAKTVEYQLSPEKFGKAKALYDLRNLVSMVSSFYPPILMLLLLELGVAARYRDWSEAIAKRHFFQAFVFVGLVFASLMIISLPLRAWQHSVALRFGLSVQGWSSWLGDLLKWEGISLAIAVMVVSGVMRLIRKSRRRWWFYAWLISAPLLLLFVFLAPIVLDPLFNKFEPLEKSRPELVRALEKVSERGGLHIPPECMFLMKASEKVTVPNAYVTGFGASKRVVVWDTTLRNATTEETLFVFGHEMGHYVLHHIAIGIISAIAASFVGFYLLYRLGGWALNRWQQRWQLRSLSDWAAIPLLMLIAWMLSLASDPISNAISRQLEHNADTYALEVTHGINPDAAEAGAHAFQLLGELSLDYPYPSKLVIFCCYDHPPIADRVRFAHDYDPWARGERPKYVR